MDELQFDDKSLLEVVDVQIEEGLKMKYKITTLKDHLQMERVDKESFLNKLSELNDEAFTLRHQQGIVIIEHDHKEYVLLQRLHLS
jgi:predicted type IV restriction endonuclease